MRSLLLGALAIVPLRAASAQGTAALYGSVRDSSSRPLRAVVRVNGHPATVADTQGRFRLSVPAGRVIVRVSFLGFQSVDDTVTVIRFSAIKPSYGF